MKGKRLGSEPTETPYAENGTYGVVGGRRLVTASYPIKKINGLLNTEGKQCILMEYVQAKEEQK